MRSYRSVSSVGPILSETDQLISGLISSRSKFPFVYKLAAYISREKGNSASLEKFLTKYLDLLKSSGENDESEERFLSVLKGKGDLRTHIRPIMPGAKIGLVDGRFATIHFFSAKW